MSKPLCAIGQSAQVRLRSTNSTIAFLRVVGIIAAVSLVLCSGSVWANSIQLLNWAPAPDVVGFPEINYNGALQTDIGAISNSDGDQPTLSTQTAGGLAVNTVVNAPVPWSFPSSVFTGGTGYYDATLSFTGLAPIGPLLQNPIPFTPLIQDTQLLGPGTFSLFSTSAAPGPVLLLQGTISNAFVTGIDGGGAGAAFTANGVTYTGGAIFGQFAGNWVASGNNFSISMTSVTPGFGLDGVSGQLAAFHSDATGEFDVTVSGVPEPSTLVLGALGFGGVLSLVRRRSKNV